MTILTNYITKDNVVEQLLTDELIVQSYVYSDNSAKYWKIQKPVVLSHTDRRAGQNKTDSKNAQGKGAGPTYLKTHRAKREHALKRGWFIPRAHARSARRGR